MSIMDTLTQDLVKFLQQYVQINTSHPNPDYQAAISFLKKQAHADGFQTQEIVLPSEKKVLIIQYLGTDVALKSIALNHHMDVVPAFNAKQWRHDPFAGVIENGLIIGRGTQDMKGVAAAHYGALKALKKSGIIPQRTIYLIAVPDEEIGGFTGTQQLVKTAEFAALNIGFVLDEGISSGCSHRLGIKVSERKAFQIRVTTLADRSAHGAMLHAYNPIHELIACLHEIVLLHQTQQKKGQEIDPGLLLSMNITSLAAGVMQDGVITMNIIPDCATATVDIRVPPLITIQEIDKMIAEIMTKFPHTSFMVQACSEEYFGEQSSNLYSVLAEVIKKMGKEPYQLYFEGSTDLRFYKTSGIDGVGFSPFTSPPALHATNESITVDELIKGTQCIYEFLREFCC